MLKAAEQVRLGQHGRAADGDLVLEQWEPDADRVGS